MGFVFSGGKGGSLMTWSSFEIYIERSSEVEGRIYFIDNSGNGRDEVERTTSPSSLWTSIKTIDLPENEQVHHEYHLKETKFSKPKSKAYITRLLNKQTP